MQIFILDVKPSRCARFHSDKHVIKQILESAQMLCSAHWTTGSKAPYKPTHINHPCNVWVRESIENYIFLCELAKFLCKEYTKRYKKIHKTEKVIEWCVENKPKIPSRGLTEFAQAMPNKYKNKNPIQAYRDYYKNEKKDFLKYTNAKTPRWLGC